MKKKTKGQKKVATVMREFKKGKLKSSSGQKVTSRKQAGRMRELEEQLKAKHSENRELYAMLSHIVDWSPELPYYMKDEYKTLFRNALAAARELLSKCSVKEGK